MLPKPMQNSKIAIIAILAILIAMPLSNAFAAPPPKPTVVLTTTASDPSSTSPFAMTATFSEEMIHTGVDSFELSDITVKKGTASDLATLDFITYTFTVTPDMEFDHDDCLKKQKVDTEVKKDVAKSLATGAKNEKSNKIKIDYEPSCAPPPPEECDEGFELIDGECVAIPPPPEEDETVIKGHGGCRGDCTHPTLTEFTVNDQTVTPTGFYTPFPLITANTGEISNTTIKACDDSGINHIALAFGLTDDQLFGEAQTLVIVDISFNGIITTTEIDPNNILSLLEVSVTKTMTCTTTTLTTLFLAPLPEGKIGVDAWDGNQNAVQGYFNEGIQVLGESLNPPAWVFIQPQKQNSPDINRGFPQVMFRNSDYFDAYKQGQELLAQETMKTMYGTGMFESFEYNVISGMYPWHDKR